MAETVRIEPRRAPSQYSGAVTDPDRPTFELVAVLRHAYGENQSIAGRQDKSWSTEIGDTVPTLYLDYAKLPPAAVFSPGDRVVAIERPGQPTYEIIRQDRGQVARLVYILGVVT